MNQERSAGKGSPYCDVAECHDLRTAYYWTTYATGSLKENGVGMSYWPDHGGDRLCGIHAIQRYRVRLGGRTPLPLAGGEEK